MSRHRTPRQPIHMAPRTRRAFLTDMGLGFGGLALATMLQQDGLASSGWSPPDGRAHFAPKAKSVIWLFMIGGTSHLESFDPKPALNKYAGETVSETPYKDVLESPFLANERIAAPDANGQIRHTVYPLQTGFRKHGESGLEISDWWPHVAACADDLCLIRSMWTEDSNHGAQLQFHTGRHRLDGFFPTIGAWVSYGLGALNENLPRFVVLGNPIDECCGGRQAHGADYLGTQHDGVPLTVDPKDPLPYARPEVGTYQEEQQAQFELLNRLNRITAARFPDDQDLDARIRSYELAYRMQTAVPDVVRFDGETQATQRLYGLDDVATRDFGEKMLATRRLVERGVGSCRSTMGPEGPEAGTPTVISRKATSGCAGKSIGRSAPC